MIRRYKCNESGAAFMIVLFIVVLVSIVGTAMLSTTTYGLQNVVNTKKEQEEFYRAEGAIEIFLSEMNNFKNSDGEKDPFSYLIEKGSSNYSIGGKEVQVNVLSMEPVDVDTHRIELEAGYLDNTQSKIKRNLTFNIDTQTKELDRTEKIYNYEIPLGQIEDRMPGGIDYNDANKLNPSYFDDIVIELYMESNISKRSLDDLRITGNGTNYTFPSNTDTNIKEILEIDNISINGANHIIEIPEGVIVHATLVDLGGMNDNSKLVIRGVLIADKIEHGGNSNIKIYSGLITKYAWANSASFRVDTSEAIGIDCSLVHSACVYINSNRYTMSSIDSTSLNFSTNR